MGMDAVTSTRVSALKRREIRKSHSCHLLFADLGAVDPLGRIFSKRVFLNLLNPLGLPIPSNAMVASKKLMISSVGPFDGKKNFEKESVTFLLFL